MFSLTIGSLTSYICVFARIGGVFAFNPIFSRRNLPTMLRMGIIFCLTLLLAPVISLPDGFDANALNLTASVFKELSVGALFGYVFSLYYYMIMLAGDIVDSQAGFSMARTMDPATQVQNAVTGSFLNILFLMYFFAGGSHLVMIKIIESTFDFIPLGVPAFNLERIASFAIGLVGGAFSLAVRLVFPFAAVEFVAEIALGILMKLIPQIHVFVINMQLKIFIAVLLLFTLISPLTNFVGSYIDEMFVQIQNSISVFT